MPKHCRDRDNWRCIISKIVVTLDGLNGSGKSTQITELAKKLIQEGIPALAISGGLIYRGVAFLHRLYFAEQVKSADEIDSYRLIDLVVAQRLQLSRDGRVALMDLPIPTEFLRHREVEAIVPYVAQLRGVREFADERVRKAADRFEGQGIVLVDGRDAGTTTFPNAPLKFFMTVSDEVAANRQGITVEAVKSRNQLDAERSLSPMVAADDAISLDTSNLSVEELTEAMLGFIQLRFPDLFPS